jgi:hypothetical protein
LQKRPRSQRVRHTPQETAEGGFLFIRDGILPLRIQVQSILLINDEAQLPALALILLAKISQGFGILAFPDASAIITEL